MLNESNLTDQETVKRQAIEMQRKVRKRHVQYLVTMIIGGLMAFSGVPVIGSIGTILLIVGFINEGRMMFNQGVIEGYRNGQWIHYCLQQSKK